MIAPFVVGDVGLKEGWQLGVGDGAQLSQMLHRNGGVFAEQMTISAHGCAIGCVVAAVWVELALQNMMGINGLMTTEYAQPLGARKHLGFEGFTAQQGIGGGGHGHENTMVRNEDCS